MTYSTEFGHHLARFFVDQDGIAVTPTSGRQVVQSSGAFCDENYESLTTTSTAICPFGFTRLVSSTADQWSLVAPPFPGITKTIVGYSTETLTVAVACRMNNSLACRVIKLTNPTTHTTTEPEMLGSGVELYGASTALWIIKGRGLSTTADFALSSAT